MNAYIFTKTEEDNINRELNTLDIADHVKKGGILYLIKRWQEIVEYSKAGYCKNGIGDNLDEYSNDLSTRELLTKLLDIVKNSDLKIKIANSIKGFDKDFEKLLVDKNICFYEHKKTAFKDKAKYFYYWGVIKTAKEELKEDLIADGRYKYYSN